MAIKQPSIMASKLERLVYEAQLKLSEDKIRELEEDLLNKMSHKLIMKVDSIKNKLDYLSSIYEPSRES